MIVAEQYHKDLRAKVLCNTAFLSSIYPRVCALYFYFFYYFIFTVKLDYIFELTFISGDSWLGTVTITFATKTLDTPWSKIHCTFTGIGWLTLGIVDKL